MNYREQRGTPSIQVSIALDGRQADVDVDYRSSSFPVMLFNGHLSAANSDVRAGNNAERHAAQWSGFQNWWRSFFGVRLDRAPDAAGFRRPTLALPKIPRAGKKDIKVMAPDFLQAWLVEGDVVAAMGYVSERAYACLAQDTPDPSAFDRGLAPFQIMVNLKAAHDAHRQARVARGSDARRAPDDPWPSRGVPPASGPVRSLQRARRCSGQVRLREPSDAGRHEGIARVRPALWRDLPHRRDRRRTPQSRCCGPKTTGIGRLCPGRRSRSPMRRRRRRRRPNPSVARIKADLTLVQAARDFMESWLVRKNYDAAFRYLSTRSYACYDLVRGPDAPASTSPDDAGRKIRSGSRTRRPSGWHVA